MEILIDHNLLLRPPNPVRAVGVSDITLIAGSIHDLEEQGVSAILYHHKGVGHEPGIHVIHVPCGQDGILNALAIRQIERRWARVNADRPWSVRITNSIFDIIERTF